jgi:hypothetical protein
MFRTFAAALLATSMVAGTAFSAAPAAPAGTTPPAVTIGGKTRTEAMTTRPANPVKRISHLRKHERKIVRKHTGRHQTKAVQSGNGGHAGNGAGITKAAAPAKIAKTTNAARVQSTKLPASRTS